MCSLMVLASFLWSCKEKSADANEIVNLAMKAHGSYLLKNSTTTFTFRDVDYQTTRSSGRYSFTRTFITDSDTIKDVKTNSNITRYRNGKTVFVSDSLKKKHDAALNSVIYFAQLPYGLDGLAVIKKYVGAEIIKGENYHKIQVTFKKDGGGEAYEDVFIYWIQKETFLVDYLAYSFCEAECGYRFRESVNRTNHSGVIMQDYKNYKSGIENIKLEQLAQLFENGKLELMSEIVNDNVTIRLIN